MDSALYLMLMSCQQISIHRIHPSSILRSLLCTLTVSQGSAGAYHSTCNLFIEKPTNWDSNRDRVWIPGTVCLLYLRYTCVIHPYSMSAITSCKMLSHYTACKCRLCIICLYVCPYSINLEKMRLLLSDLMILSFQNCNHTCWQLLKIKMFDCLLAPTVH